MKKVNGKFSEAKENIIINFVDCYTFESVNDGIISEFPHIEKEYLRYARHFKKTKNSIEGDIQFVPIDTWALIMVDTINDKNIEAYDKEYQYVVNIFVDTENLNVNKIKQSINNVDSIASKLNVSVAIDNYSFSNNIKLKEFLNTKNYCLYSN